MLERALDLTNKGPVVLLWGYQTPAAIRRTGARRIETWLRNRKVRGSESLAKTALEAAQAQQTALPGEKLAAAMVIRMAKAVMALDEEITELDALIEDRFREHPHAEVIRSLPGMGSQLGAEFIAATGGGHWGAPAAHLLNIKSCPSSCLTPIPRLESPDRSVSPSDITVVAVALTALARSAGRSQK